MMESVPDLVNDIISELVEIKLTLREIREKYVEKYE